MRTIFAEYNPQCNSIDVYTSVGYMLRIDCSPTAKDCIKCRPKCVPRSPAASFFAVLRIKSIKKRFSLLQSIIKDAL